jgi:hypothetical protein
VKGKRGGKRTEAAGKAAGEARETASRDGCMTLVHEPKHESREKRTKPAWQATSWARYSCVNTLHFVAWQDGAGMTH